MNNISVNRLELIARVQKNRDEHRDLFLKAQEGFRARVVEELDAMLADARSDRPLRTQVRLRAPEDHTADYDRTLDMLAMTGAAEVAIDEHEFARLVRNEWDWFQRSLAMNSTYASGGKLDL